MTRVEPRDYVDIAAALDHYTISQLVGLARQRDAGLKDRDFTDAGRELDRLPDGLFARYGLSPADVATLRKRFADWSRG